MALDIVAKDIIIDETPGLQNLQPPATGPNVGDDINPVGNPDPTLQYLVGLDTAGGLPPEVAFKQDFVVASASAGETITGIALSQNLAGTAFSKTVGVNSQIQ